MTAHGAEAAAGDPGWRFDNAYARLPPLLFARVAPTPVRAPRLVWLNRRLAVELGLDPDALAAGAAEWFSGNRPPAGAEPIAQAYAGHQYGHFTNLGDGRAILLGEQVTPAGTRVDIQLKGAGRTPFSRSGDGRAALGPMLREAIVGEAMHALGIPTTRALAVVATSGRPVTPPPPSRRIRRDPPRARGTTRAPSPSRAPPRPRTPGPPRGGQGSLCARQAESKRARASRRRRRCGACGGGRETWRRRGASGARE